MLSENLKRAREAKGLTQEQLSDLTHVHRVNIAKYETGMGIPSVASLKAIADALDVSFDWLLDREAKRNG
jgi:transcriptional regulator with XRE-family HTH domain